MRARIHTHLLAVVAALVVAAAPAHVRAQVNTAIPELEAVGVDEHLQAQLPVDARFRDHDGREVRLGRYFDGRRPLVLTLAYFRCPTLCNMVMTNTVRALAAQTWSLGDRYDAVTISIDPTETPRDAAAKRTELLAQYGRAGGAQGWAFLTGDELNIRRVSDTVGFRYRYDARTNQYAHAAVIFLVTPSGRVARYLYGLQFDPNDVRVGLLEASEGRSITTVERIILFCYHYDPQGRKYALVAKRVMQVGGGLTALALGVFLALMWRLEARRRRKDRDAAALREADAVATAGPSTTALTPPHDARG